MTITVQCYGALASLTDAFEHELELTPGDTPKDIVAAMSEQFPNAAGMLGVSACAIGEDIIGKNDPLTEGTTLALLPPVGGG